MVNKNPLISVNLPTFNGADNVEQALKSVIAQTYKNYEIVVVDHYSTDGTLDIVKKYTDKVYLDKKRILNSRKIGLKKSKGEIILFLSCDQVLSPDLFERTVKMFQEQDIDMIINEERSYKPRKFIERLTDIDRKVVHEKREIHPCKSVLLPSTFKREILEKVLEKFSDEVLERVTIQEHAMIYYEAWKISKKIGYLDKAVYHDEPKTVKELFSHYYSWGRRANAVKGILSKEYRDMFESKLRNRLKTINLFNGEEVRALPVTFLKGAGFRLGSYFG